MKAFLIGFLCSTTFLFPHRAFSLDLLRQGDPAPFFSVTRGNGASFSLEKELAEGPVLLLFWSILCRECGDTLNDLGENSALLNGALSVVAINVDGPEKREFVLNYPEQLGLKGTFLQDNDGTIRELYRVPVVIAEYVENNMGSLSPKARPLKKPVSYLIGKNRKILSAHVGLLTYENLRSGMKTLPPSAD